MNTQTNQRGQALILIVLGIVGLVSITALAIDAGNSFSDRRNAQNAADAAAMAGALAKTQGSTSDQVRAIARNLAAINDFDNNGTTNNVDVHDPPISGPYIGNPQYVQVIITSTVNTFFAGIVGVEQLTNRVEAVARAILSTTDEMFLGNAMVSLSPNTCRAFRVSGSSNTTVTGGGIFTNSNSRCQQGDFNQSGNGRITAPSNCVVGSFSYSDGKVIPPPSPCEPFPYPPQYILPEPTCAVYGTRTGSKKDGYTLTAGNIPGGWISDKTTLGAGVYCISGDVSINAHDTITGSNVMLFFESGGLSINGSAKVILDAPDSGAYAGLLIYLPITNSSDISLNGNADSQFIGTVLAPSVGTEIQINGTGNANAYQTQIIGYTIDLIGNASVSVHYSDENNYDATIPPSIELAK